MKIDPRSLIAPLVGMLVLVLVGQATQGALRASGAWQTPSRPRLRPESPYARLDAMLSSPGSPALPEPLRDPFAYAPASSPPAPPLRPRHRQPAPVAAAPPAQAPQPLLTSIIWDADPRATVRWDGRDFPVRENSLFADFIVKSIRRDEVVLERDGQQLVLKLTKKGE